MVEAVRQRSGTAAVAGTAGRTPCAAKGDGSAVHMDRTEDHIVGGARMTVVPDNGMILTRVDRRGERWDAT